MGRTTVEVLRSAKQVLENAMQGASDFRAGGERRLSGLYNAVSSGRSVTFVLQNLRSPEPEFDEWYLPRQQALKADPVAKFFHDLRNRIEKEGDHGQTSTSVTLSNISTDDLVRNAPPGTRSTFVGDSLGRSGWHVLLPDGTETTVYFTLPKEMGVTALNLEGAPSGRDIEGMLSDWLAMTQDLYHAAVDRFAPNESALHLLASPISDGDRTLAVFDDQATAAMRAAIDDSGYGPRQ